MNKQNEMMDFVWLLNAASASAFETKELYLEFLRREQDFLKLKMSIPSNSVQGDYLEQEIKKNLENFEDLQKRIQEVIVVLQSSEKEQKNDDQ